jgi:hypothetical protein
MYQARNNETESTPALVSSNFTPCVMQLTSESEFHMSLLPWDQIYDVVPFSLGGELIGYLSDIK